jgi:hypothetical protein
MRPMLLLCAIVALLRGGESVDSIQATWQQVVDAATATYQQGVETAGKAYASSVGKARESCIAALVATAKREVRKDDRSGATAAWGEILRLRPDHPEANAYLDLLPKEQADRLRAELAQPAPATEAERLLKPGPTRHAAVAADLGKLDEVEKRERAVFNKAEAVCRSRFADAEGKARSKALASLGQLAERASRSGELPAAAAAWKAALILQDDHPPAIAFYNKLGTTAEVLATLPPPADLLGPPPDPAGFIQGLAAGTPGATTLRGMKIVLVGEAEARPFALQAKVTERLLKAGAQVTVLDHAIWIDGGGAVNTAIETAVDAADVVLCLRVSDASRGGLVRLLRHGRIGVLGLDTVAFSTAGLAERYSYNGYLRGPVEPIEPIAGLRHPILLGLPPSLPWLLPAKTTGKPDPAAEPGIDQNAHFALNYDLCPGAVSLFGLPGRPEARIAVAYDVGLVLQPRDDRGKAPAGPPTPATDPNLLRTTARRVALHLFNDSKLSNDPAVVQRISPQAWKLFDACLVWARGR